MYPFIRLGKTLFKSSLAVKKGDTLTLTGVSFLDLTIHPHDIDSFLEVNNGRIFTLLDLGRTDFAIRSGLGKVLIKNRWGLVVAGSTIQYRKRIRTFDKVTLKTKIAAIDERWFYTEQSMWVKNNCMCIALLRTAVTNFATGKVINTQQVLTALGYDDVKMPPNQWVQAWIDADKLRPYPTNIHEDDKSCL